MAAVSILLLTWPSLAHAQGDIIRYYSEPPPDTDHYTVLHDDAGISRSNYSDDMDPSDANGAAAAYLFTVEVHASAFVQYRLTSARRNRTALSIPWWPDDRLPGADAGISGAARSIPDADDGGEIFACAAGDTLRFERELFWYAAPDEMVDSGESRARDWLAYAVELVRASDSARLALIDSIGILPDYEPGRPGVYGPYPLHATVRFTIPAELGGVPAFIRLRPYHRGGMGIRWWARSDGYARGESTLPRPRSPGRHPDRTGLGNPFYDTRLLNTLEDHTPTAPGLEVAVSTGRPRRATVLFAPAADGGTTAIGVYDANGRALSHPFSARALSMTQSVEFDLPPEVSCYIGLLYNGRITATRRVTVPR